METYQLWFSSQFPWQTRSINVKYLHKPPPVMEKTYPYYGRCAFCGEPCNGFAVDAGLRRGCNYAEPAWVCESCAKELLKICPKCKQKLIGEDQEMCDDCAIVKCSLCLVTYDVDDERIHLALDGKYYCDNCVMVCEECSEIIWPYESIMYDGDTAIHESCRDHWRVCEGCNHLFREEYFTRSRDGDYYCENCVSNHDFGYELTFNGDGDDLFLGIELEMDLLRSKRMYDRRGDTVDRFSALPNSNALYMKICGDDSLSEYGIEIASMPCTLKFHQTKFPWAKICDIGADAGYRSHNGPSECGIHIHVNRNILSVKEQLKLAWFVYSQKSHMETIARRRESGWAKFKAHVDGPSDSRSNSNPDRYEALNWQNMSTVEFRLWRGSLRVETLLGTIDLTHAIVRYTQQTDGDALLDRTPAWNGFIQFVEDRKDTYPYGWDYLVYRNLVTEDGDETVHRLEER